MQYVQEVNIIRCRLDNYTRMIELVDQFASMIRVYVETRGTLTNLFVDDLRGMLANRARVGDSRVDHPHHWYEIQWDSHYLARHRAESA